jgi:hypothetical protein
MSLGALGIRSKMLNWTVKEKINQILLKPKNSQKRLTKPVGISLALLRAKPGGIGRDNRRDQEARRTGDSALKPI